MNEDSQAAPSADAVPGAVIGTGIVIRGDVSGDEDLTVHGRIEGSVSLPQHRVVIGAQGKVHANVHARTVEVCGTVEGDLRGDEQVTVRSTGDIVGNISAPRVSLEDGSRFRGSIDMDVKPSGADGRKGTTKPVMMAAADRG